jgi:hypothetical protein
MYLLRNHLSVVGNAATTALVAVEIAPCPAPATNAAIAALVPAVVYPSLSLCFDAILAPS